MFVQSAIAINHKHKNGVALRQRLGHRETLVQWANGDQRWVPTADLQGTVRLIAANEQQTDADYMTGEF